MALVALTDDLSNANSYILLLLIKHYVWEM